MSKVKLTILVLIAMAVLYGGWRFWTGSVAVTSQSAKANAQEALEKLSGGQKTSQEDFAGGDSLATSRDVLREVSSSQPEPEPQPQLTEGLSVPDKFKVKLETTKGDIILECVKEWAPIGAARFYELVKSGYYDNQKFFRVVPGFVVQWGIAADPVVSAKWMNARLKDDPVKKSNVRGTLTYAKSAAPNSRSTQLFINLGDNSANLDPQGFAPFGAVIEGMDVVESLYSEYEEQTTSLQGQIYAQGNAFLEQRFPELDTLLKAVVVEDGAPAGDAAGTAPSVPAG